MRTVLCDHMPFFVDFMNAVSGKEIKYCENPRSSDIQDTYFDFIFVARLDDYELVMCKEVGEFQHFYMERSLIVQDLSCSARYYMIPVRTVLEMLDRESKLHTEKYTQFLEERKSQENQEI